MYNLTPQTLSTSTPSFVFHNTTIRTLISESGEPLFCFADVCAALEVIEPNSVERKIKREFEIPVLNTGLIPCTAGVRAPAFLLTEPQLYFVIMRGRTSLAHEFRHWIFNEVIPAIRKIGAYHTLIKEPQESSARELLESASFLLEKAGVTGNQLILCLDRLHKAKTGESLLTLTGATLPEEHPEAASETGSVPSDNQTEIGYVPADDHAKQLFTASQIGDWFETSPQIINRTLASLGYQVKVGNIWEPTEKGLAAGGTLIKVNKLYSAGSVCRLKWPLSIKDVIQEFIDKLYLSDKTFSQEEWGNRV